MHYKISIIRHKACAIIALDQYGNWGEWLSSGYSSAHEQKLIDTISDHGFFCTINFPGYSLKLTNTTAFPMADQKFSASTFDEIIEKLSSYLSKISCGPSVPITMREKPFHFQPTQEMIDKAKLFKAIKNSDINEINQLINTCKDNDGKSYVNCYEGDGTTETLLATAIMTSDNTEIIDALLAAGADVNKANFLGYTPLHFSVKYNRIETLKVLLSAGAKVDKADNARETPLYKAAKDGLTEIVKILLIEGKANATIIADFGSTPIKRAAASGHTDVVKLLIQHGPNDPKYLAEALSPATNFHYTETANVLTLGLNRSKFMLFALGRHKRVGKDSPVGVLIDDVMGCIAQHLVAPHK